jgi:hypothetical protein
MDNKLENNEWMDEAPFLAKLPRATPFATPPGYFEGLQDQINTSRYIDKLKEEAGASGMAVPEGYFEQSQKSILSRIAEEELKTKVQEDGFAVPEGYFADLNSRILSQVTPESSKREKGQIFKLWHSKAMKYSTAACIVIISAIGLYVNQQQASSPAPTNIMSVKATAEEQTLFDIDEEVILDQMDTDHAQHVANTTASQSEMEDYILNNYSQNDIASNL